MTDITLFENHDIVYEMSAVDAVGWKNLASAKPVTQKELLDLMEPSDILVTRINMRKVPGISKLNAIAGTIAGKVLSDAQGLPFISSKMVGNNKQVIGFSASGHGSKVDVVSGAKFLTYQKNVLLCKNPKGTEEQKQKAVKYMMDKRDLDYATSKLIKVWWERVLKGEKLPGKRQMDKKIDESQAWVWKEALVCSSIIAMAYIAAGMRLDFTKTPLETWPKDFVASKDLKQVAVLYQ